MNLLNIRSGMITEAMEIDGRDVFKRITKIQEEHGELNEAHLEGDMLEASEEGVDNMLVLASIAHMLDKNSLPIVELHVNNAFQAGINDTLQTTELQLCHLLMNYTVRLGRLSEAVQKYEKVGASAYKGTITLEETLQEVYNSLDKVMFYVGKICKDHNLINELIIKKNAKWLEKSKKTH